MYKVATIVVTVPVVGLVQKAVERVWRSARPARPVTDPKERDAGLGDAVGFAALTAAGAALSEVLVRKTADSAYRAATHMEPPSPPLTKAQKKALKAEEKAAKAEAKAAKKTAKASKNKVAKDKTSKKKK